MDFLIKQETAGAHIKALKSNKRSNSDPKIKIKNKTVEKAKSNTSKFGTQAPIFDKLISAKFPVDLVTQYNTTTNLQSEEPIFELHFLCQKISSNSCLVLIAKFLVHISKVKFSRKTHKSQMPFSIGEITLFEIKLSKVLN